MICRMGLTFWCHVSLLKRFALNRVADFDLSVAKITFAPDLFHNLTGDFVLWLPLKSNYDRDKPLKLLNHGVE